MNTKIDFVIPWVDGSDPEWNREKKKYISSSEVDDEVRYRDWDNLQYWFRGVEKFAPWVNQIYFITWGHIPKWLNVNAKKLTVVKHEDYIPDKYLPTFSSHPIELNLHRLKELEEHFVYFNDDIFLLKPVTQEDFFKNGLPCDYARESPIAPNRYDVFNDILMNNLIFLNQNYNRREVLKKQRKKFFSFADKKGWLTNRALSILQREDFFGFDYPHLASNCLKSSLAALWDLNEDLFDNVSSHRTRSREDVNQYLIANYQYINGLFSPRCWAKMGYDVQLDDGVDGNIKEAYQTIRRGSIKMICINDTDVKDFEKTKKIINRAFEKLLPQKSSFEL